MKRISELLFRIDYLVDKSTRQFKKEFLSLNQVIKKMKDLYNNMERMDDGTVDTAYFYQHFFGRVIYTFSTDTDHSKVHIYCPDNMSKELFLTILKGAGIYEEKSGYGVIDTKDLVKKRLKKSSIQKSSELKFKFVLIEPYNKRQYQSYTEGELSLLSLKRLMKKYYKELESKRDGFVGVRVIRCYDDEVRYEFETDNYQSKIYIPNPFGIGKNTEAFLKILEGAGLYRTGTNNNDAIGSHVEESMKKSAELKFEVEMAEDFFDVKASWVNKKKLTIKEILLDVQTTLHFFNSLSNTHPVIEKKVWYDKISRVTYIEGRIRLTRTIVDINNVLFDTKDYYIKQPKNMPDSAFESIMGSLEKQIMGKMKRTSEFDPRSISKRAELQFQTMLQTRIGERAYFEDYHFSIKELKDEIDNYPSKDGWIGEKVHIDKKSNWVEITYRDRGSVTPYYTDFYISKPSSIDWKTFLTILEQAKVILKKPTLKKSAELKFKFEHNTEQFYSPSPNNQQWLNGERNFHVIPLKELINKVSKFKKEMKLTYNTYNASRNHYHVLLWKDKDSRLPQQHEIFIHKPEGMTPQVFKTLIADRLDRILK